MNILENGIDVSHWQGKIDFEAVREKGYTFVMIKAGGADSSTGKPYKDIKFEENYANAKKAGLKVGAYWFTGYSFYSPARGHYEAEEFIKLLDGKQFDYPVACDIEAVASSWHIDNITDACIEFCDTLEQAGYYVTIYASDVRGFRDKLNLSRLAKYDKWVAKYSTIPPKVCQNYGMWQYSNMGNFACVESPQCDLNYSFLDYSYIIKSLGKNGYDRECKLKDVVLKQMSAGDVKTAIELANKLQVHYEVKE